MQREIIWIRTPFTSWIKINMEDITFTREHLLLLIIACITRNDESQTIRT